MRTELLAQLAREAARIGFFEVVRLLEHALDAQVALGPGSDEAITFAHAATLAFPESDVQSVAVEKRSAKVTTTFLGLLGTASPLTPEWTEQVLYEDDDGALAAFYDVFHHRALALLYAAWKVHSLEGGFDLRGTDPLSKRLRSLAGIDGWAEDVEEALPPMAALGLADYQRGQPQSIDLRSAEGLLRRLYPDWNVRLVGEVARFLEFAPAERVRLGEAHSRLGEDLVYGDGCTEAEGLVRVLLGPVDAETCESLMPGGAQYLRLERLTRQLFAGTKDVEVEVEVAPDEAPRCVLGQPAGGRLGVDTLYSADRNAAVRMRAPLLQNPALADRTIL
jgi:type VI secretion system protein ImpH